MRALYRVFDHAPPSGGASEPELLHERMYGFPASRKGAGVAWECPSGDSGAVKGERRKNAAALDDDLAAGRGMVKGLCRDSTVAAQVLAEKPPYIQFMHVI